MQFVFRWDQGGRGEEKRKRKRPGKRYEGRGRKEVRRACPSFISFNRVHLTSWQERERKRKGGERKEEALLLNAKI